MAETWTRSSLHTNKNKKSVQWTHNIKLFSKFQLHPSNPKFRKVSIDNWEEKCR